MRASQDKIAALGFRSHSGWAAAVAVTDTPSHPVVLARRRIVTCEEIPGSKQPYHAVESFDLTRAKAWIRTCRAQSSRLAGAAIRVFAADVHRQGYRVAGVGILFAAGRSLPELPQILKSHALLHTAEGEFYREVLVSASEHCALPVTRMKEREAWDIGESLFGLPSADLRRRIGELGRVIGPPWREDEKLAALAAWIALAELR